MQVDVSTIILKTVILQLSQSSMNQSVLHLKILSIKNRKFTKNKIQRECMVMAFQAPDGLGGPVHSFKFF